MISSVRTRCGLSWDDMKQMDVCRVTAEIRALATDCVSIEQFVQRTMECLVDWFRPAVGPPSEIVLARCFLTERPSDERANNVDGISSGDARTLESSCLQLVLTGSAGAEEYWNDPMRSCRHSRIPLRVSELETTYPLFVEVFRRTGLWRDSGSDEVVLDLEAVSSSCVNFSLPVSPERAYISDPQFVDRYGIRFVLGCIGECFNGRSFMTILFVRRPVSPHVLTLFRLVCLAMQLGMIRVQAARLGKAGVGQIRVIDDMVNHYEASMKSQIQALLDKDRETRLLGERVIAIQEEERSRLARELHDHVVSGLGGIGFVLRSLVQLPPQTKEEMLTALQGVIAENDALVSSTRTLALRLHPVMVDRLGISASLSRLIDDVERRHGFRIVAHVTDVRCRLIPMVAAGLYRIAEEALQNVVKHAGVQECGVGLSLDGSILELCVSDTGRGFVVRHSTAGEAGLGLLSMAERARQIGAEMTIESALGTGTTLKVRVSVCLEHQQEDLHGAGSSL